MHFSSFHQEIELAGASQGAGMRWMSSLSRVTIIHSHWLLPVRFINEWTLKSVAAGGVQHIVNSIIDVVLSLRIDLATVSEWLRANKLTLNVSKTKYMIMGPKNLVNKVQDQYITISGEQIGWVDVFEYLGLWLDESLTFDHHITKVYNKVCQPLGRWEIALANLWHLPYTGVWSCPILTIMTQFIWLVIMTHWIGCN